MADIADIYTAASDRYEKMTYNRVGRSGLKFPAVSLGLWHNFGSKDNYDNMELRSLMWQIIMVRCMEVPRRVLEGF